jgi:tetratricopeptide (TPR) repeat protein
MTGGKDGSIMDTLTQQDQKQSIQRLHTLLQGIDAPAKSEEQWDRLSQRVFGTLDARSGGAPRQWRISFMLPQLSVLQLSAAASTVAAVLLIAAGLSLRISVGQPLPTASVIRSQGAVEVSWVGSGRADPNRPWNCVVPSLGISKGLVLRTPQAGAVTIGLEPGTGIEVGENSIVEIRQVTSKYIAVFLEKGTVLAEVSKRAHGQSFRILTPNAECRVVGTIFKVDVTRDSRDNALNTTLSVMRGEVRMVRRAGSDGVSVAEGQYASVRNVSVTAVLPLAASEQTDRSVQLLKAGLAESGPQRSSVMSFASEPSGAEVFVDGVSQGATPLSLAQTPGAHRVSISYLNFDPWDSLVTVGVRAAANIDVSMKRCAARSKDASSSTPSTVRRLVKGSVRGSGVAALPAEPEPAAVADAPEFVQAMAQIEGKKYEEAIAGLAELGEREGLSVADRLAVLGHVVTCLRHLGRFQQALTVLDRMYDMADTPVRKDKILWETVVLKADNLADYQGAEMDLIEYLVTQPQGIWIYEAYTKLAEVQYLLKKYKAAARTYEQLIAAFPDESDLASAVYALAYIERHDLDDCETAVRWYTRLVKDYASSEYLEDATFWRAECYSRLGRVREAREEFQKYSDMFPTGRWKQAVAEQMRGR